MGSTLRIVSANLWREGADPEALADQVRALEADVVAVQELAAPQAEALASVLPHGTLAPHEGFHGLGIASRRPVQVDPLPLPYRGGFAATLLPQDWPGLQKPLEVANVHIAAPQVMPVPLGFWHRRRQVQALERYLVETPVDGRVLLGDFNATPIWGVYRRISSQLTDAAIAVAQQRGRPVAPTWGPWSSAPRLLRIDHAFTHGVRVEEFQVVHVRGADHSAIVIDCSLD
ncbi:MAG: endonuclease/exonuclease/phosphatase family protein [Proteobacteria bacterium]|nr:endonuclease/exonuclease/phosphatase family protein [Pseudomonadota bacterium]